MEIDGEVDNRTPETVQARFVSDDGEEAGPPLELPTIVTVSQLGRICNAILQNVRRIDGHRIRILVKFTNFVPICRKIRSHIYFSSTKKRWNNRYSIR